MFKQFDADEIVAILTLCSIILGPLIVIYVICHFGDYLEQDFRRVGNEFYEISWYNLPVNLQKDWPFLIAMAQQETGLRGFGKICFNREMFMKIVKASYSYFTMLNQIL